MTLKEMGKIFPTDSEGRSNNSVYVKHILFTDTKTMHMNKVFTTMPFVIVTLLTNESSTNIRRN